MIGLLTSVRKYPVGDADPLENFITEAWCWILKHNTALSQDFVKWAFLSTGPTGKFDDLTWSTQVRVPNAGIMDLVGENENVVVIFEHKTWSSLTSEQIESYLSGAKKKFRKLEIFIAAVTGYPVREKSISAEARAITWSQVAAWIEGRISSAPYDGSTPEEVIQTFALREFLALLTNEGMGPMKPIELETLRNFYKFSNIVPSMKQLFGTVSHGYNWKHVYEAMPRKDSKEEPRSIKDHWGRLGIEFTRQEDWRPGIFFGALLDGEDHGVEPSNPEIGPDLCVIFSFDYSLRKRYPDDPDYHNFKSELEKWAANSDEGWAFFDHLASKGKKKNVWHPLYLRQPLAPLLKDHGSFDEQVAILRKKMDGVISMLVGPKIAAPSFLKLRKKFDE